MRKIIVAGWNMPGYMPDSEPSEFESFKIARSYLADEIKQRAESLQDRTDSECFSDACMTGDYSKTDALAETLFSDAEIMRKGIGEIAVTLAGIHYFATIGN